MPVISCTWKACTPKVARACRKTNMKMGKEKEAEEEVRQAVNNMKKLDGLCIAGGDVESP